MTQEQLVEQIPTKDEPAIVTAFMGLTDGLQNLMRTHIKLAQHEIKADTMSLGKDIGAVIVALVFVLIGYVLLNVSAIFFSAWFGGIVAMAITTLSLAIIHLVGGAIVLRSVVAQLKSRHYGLTYTSDEIERSKSWAKTMPENI